MRTELRLLTVLLSFVVLPLCSCNKEQGDRESFTLAGTELKFDKHGGIQKVEFNSSCAWKAHSSKEWCKLSSVSGSYQATYINVSVPANETLEDRTAVITFTAGSITKELSVFQEKGDGKIDPPSEYVIPGDDIPNHARVTPEGKAGWTKTTVADGVVYWEFQGRDPVSNANQFIHVSDIDLNKGYKLGYNYDANKNICSDIMKKYDAVVSMNGGFGATQIYIKVDGNVKRKIEKDKNADTGVLNWRNDAGICTDPNGRVFIANAVFSQDGDGQSEYGARLAEQRNFFDKTLDRMPNIISGAPLLIDGYNPLGLSYIPIGEGWEKHKDDTEHPFYHQDYRHPRTAIGITGDNHLIMFVVDGRLTDCAGFNAKEMTQFLVDNFDPKYAMNLDGGGSSTMCVRGLGDTSTHVVNWPCDNGKCDHAGERTVQTFLFITGPEGSSESEPEDNIKVREDVPIQAFYKDLFLDGGIHASSKTSLPAAEMLNLSQEYLITPNSTYTAADTLAQNKAFVGSNEDLNGYLLYPDGAPRYRCVFVNGGNATAHGRSLTEQGRENFRTFVKNGGCYAGSCAGAFVATIGSATQLHDTYIGLWPSRANNCNLSDAHTGMFIDSDSPLLKYYDFGGDNYVADVYHNGGCYCDESYMIPGTEPLARYDYDVDPEKHDHMHGKTSIWAYKPDAASGRVIMSGSHPENVQSGEIRDLMAAILRYALDGQGITSAKAILHNNETISMNKSTSDHDPAHTRIGDLQCHHFVMWIPAGTRKARITLKPREQFKFALRLAKDSFAYEGCADYQFTGAEGETIVADIDNISEGQWYICVQCLSVPTATAGTNGTRYTSNAILNGAAYDISLSY